MNSYYQKIKVKGVFVFCIINLFLSIFLIFYGVFASPSLALGQIFSQRYETIFCNIAVAPVKLDGHLLFEVTSPITFVRESDEVSPIYSVQQRVERIEKTLYSLLENSDRNTLKIEVSTLNNQTIIIASDAQQIRKVIIVTITEFDAQLSLMSITELGD